MNKAKLAQLAGDVRTGISRRSPEILIGFGLTGMVMTAVLAVKATPKALEKIEEKKVEEKVEELPPIDIFKITWKYYVPAATSAVFAGACIIGANSVNAKRNAAIATAYKLSETAFAEYKGKVIETIGEKKEKTVREKVAQERVEKNPVTKREIIFTNTGDTLCYDPLSGRYFKSDIDKIKRAENEINRRMLHDISGYASLNEFYDEIGLSHTDIGDNLGWNAYNLLDLDYFPQMTDDGQPCVAIDYKVAPRYDYERF